MLKTGIKFKFIYSAIFYKLYFYNSSSVGKIQI